MQKPWWENVFHWITTPLVGNIIQVLFFIQKVCSQCKYVLGQDPVLFDLLKKNKNWEEQMTQSKIHTVFRGLCRKSFSPKIVLASTTHLQERWSKSHMIPSTAMLDLTLQGQYPVVLLEHPRAVTSLPCHITCPYYSNTAVDSGLPVPGMQAWLHAEILQKWSNNFTASSRASPNYVREAIYSRFEAAGGQEDPFAAKCSMKLLLPGVWAPCPAPLLLGCGTWGSLYLLLPLSNATGNINCLWISFHFCKTTLRIIAGKNWSSFGREKSRMGDVKDWNRCLLVAMVPTLPYLPSLAQIKGDPRGATKACSGVIFPYFKETFGTAPPLWDTVQATSVRKVT